jgi:hypothetical protein
MDPQVCGQIPDCFSFDLSYDDLKLRIERITGIGGMPRMYGQKYQVVTGDQYKGMGKALTNDADNNQTQINYFVYDNGAQAGIGELIGTRFEFTMPIDKQQGYENVCDTIATSVKDLTPPSTQPYAKAYVDYEAKKVMGVNQGGNSYIIHQANASNQERIETAIINPSGEYLAITIFIGNGPDSYLYFYNINSKALLDFNGTTRFPTIGDREVWIDNSTVIDADLDGFYKYNVKNLTKTSITKEEYAQLFKEAT